MLWDTAHYEVLSSVVKDSFIHAQIRSRVLLKEFWITFVYAPNDFAHRLLLWDQHVLLKPQAAAWLLTGDFNNVLQQSERVGGQLVYSPETVPFRNCLAECEVEDMRSCGNFFTWSNGTVRSKIDRALVNGDWMAQFPGVEARFEHGRLSDHTPILIDIHQAPL